MGDFSGGLATRRSSVALTILGTQAIGLLAVLAVLAVTGTSPPPIGALAWAAAAGLAGTAGLGAYFVALARGTMGLVAPLAALIGAGLPAMVGLLTGEQLGLVRAGGLLLGLLAVVLISLPARHRTDEEERRFRRDLADLPLVVLSGIGFAGFYLLIDRARLEGADIWWSLAGVRVAGLSTVVLVLGILVLLAAVGSRRERLRDLLGARAIARSRRPWLVLGPLLLLSGLGDLGGNGFFIMAVELELLSVSVVLSSLYPVVTTIAAAVLLGERLSPLQLIGVVLALLAVALIAGG
ncbi:MAG TPA: EamA family transporter [Candidatus Limnocylindrales bacterium]|nr:EamA family transporter [Candidatus Limnocylindrales bacterium]